MNNRGQIVVAGSRVGDNTEAILTQSGAIVAEGDTLPDGTVIDNIVYGFRPLAINDRGAVTFTGISTEGADGVFTQDGIVAATRDTLPDGTILGAIHTGGQPINNLGTVVFSARIVGSSTSGLFTQNGLIIAGCDTLPDGTTLEARGFIPILDINNRGQVAFLGRIQGTSTGAIFTLDGVLVAEGDTLPDGVTVGSITDFTDVAINDWGVVAFAGRLVDGSTAIFTQNGVVAAEGGTLPDGTTLGPIVSFSDAIAINNRGVVAFLAEVDGATAVLVATDARAGRPLDALVDALHKLKPRGLSRTRGRLRRGPPRTVRGGDRTDRAHTEDSTR